MVRHSGATHKNEAVQDWSADFADRDNLAFFQAALDALARGVDRIVGRRRLGAVGRARSLTREPWVILLRTWCRERA